MIPDMYSNLLFILLLAQLLWDIIALLKLSACAEINKYTEMIV